MGPGTRLGPYEIEGLAGSGGMGEVYRARDTRLHRTVAIKVLPPHLRDDIERKAQFEREAQAIARLNHPHICVLYDIAHQDGIDYLVLEHLEGETLAARLQRGPIAIDEALRYALEIVDALERAHREGVVHRDLKPSNVMLTDSGIKLLDFGLARLATPPRSRDLSAPTEGGSFGAGRIVGTLPYMSPEQLQGKPVDARSDLFAFGSLLHEMVTGRNAFARTSDAEVIAAVLQSDLTPLSTTRSFPPALDLLIRRCLAKDPGARWQSAADLKAQLEWINRDTIASSPPVKLPVAKIAALFGFLVAAAVIAIVWLPPRSRRQPPPEPRHTQITSLGNVTDVALAPDDRTIAFVTDELPEHRLMARDLSGGPAIELFRGGAVGRIAWSPDGSMVSFYLVGRGIYTVPRFGGEPRRISPHGYYAWTRESARIVTADAREGGVRIVRLADGETKRLPIDGLLLLQDLRSHPTSERVAVIGRDRGGQWTVWDIDADATVARRVYSDTLALRAVRWSPDGDALYVLRARDEATDVLKVPTATHASAVTQVLLSGLPAIESGATANVMTLSSDGRRLVHIRALNYSNLWTLDLTRSGTTTPITKGTARFRDARVSPDSQWIAVALGSGSQIHIAKVPIAGGHPIMLTAGNHQNRSPAWSPDGQRIAFATNRNGRPQVFTMSADGGGETLVASDGVGTNMIVVWAPDGRVLWQDPSLLNYRMRDLTAGTEGVIFADDASSRIEFSPRFSKAGDRVAVSVNQSGRAGISALDWPKGRDLFLSKQGALPLYPLGWSADDHWIYAYELQGQIISALSSRTGEIRQIAKIVEGRIESGDLLPNGREAVISVLQRNGDAWMIENFDPDIAARRH